MTIRIEVAGVTVQLFSGRQEAINEADSKSRFLYQQHRQVKVQRGYLIMNLRTHQVFDENGLVPEEAVKELFPLKAGELYWVKGRGVCRYSHATTGVAHVVNPYQFPADEFSVDLYVDPQDIMYLASKEEVKQYKANVKAALDPKKELPRKHG